MALVVGDSYGQVHHVSLESKEILDTGGEIAKDRKITMLSVDFGASPTDYYAASSRQILGFPANANPQQFDFNSEYSIVGLDAVRQNVLYSYEDGSVCILDKESDGENIIFKFNTQQPRSKGCINSYNEAEYLFIGPDQPPILIDLNRQVITWQAKNVPHDELDLKVSMKDVDAVFYNKGNCLAVPHAQRKIRLYDIKKGQRKPIFDREFTQEKGKFTKILQSKCENYFYVASAQGGIFQHDKRKELNVIGKMKGATGTVKAMDLTPDGQYLVSGSLDQYVRIYKVEDNQMVDNMYVARPIHSLAMLDNIDMDVIEERKEEEAEAPKQKAPKRKNTVALPYLKPRKIQEKEQGDQNQEKRQEDS